MSPYDPRPVRRDDPAAVRGGVEEALDRLAAGLAARGHDVTVVTSAAQASDRVADDGVRFVRVRRRATIFRTPLAPFARAVPREADLVHVPATYPFVSDLIPLRERARGRPTVVEYHFDVHGAGAAMRAAAYVHARTLGRGIRAATRVVVKSPDYARHSPVLRALPRARLDHVPNGVDVDAFRLAPKGADILCVGRLVPYKGVEVLLRAMPEVHRMTGARLVVVGDGPLRARLESLARDLHAPVSFLGRVEAETLRGLYASARLTVLPSANAQEAFGIALLESMASGTPVVASDLPGVRRVAQLAGLVAPPGDALALADMIVRAWSDPSRFGTPTEIRERVRARYDWRVVVQRMEEAYARALGGPVWRQPARLPARRSARQGAT